MFAAAGLADASHTFTIEVTGRQNASAAGALIVVDAFDVPAMAISRLQETDPSVTVLCRLGSGQSDRHVDPRSHHGLDSGRFAQRVERRGRSVVDDTRRASDFTFTGTGISWNRRSRNPERDRSRFPGWHLGRRGRYVLAQGTNPGGGIRATGLAATSHTLTIEGTGQQNAFSQNALIVVDAFDVTTPERATRNTDPAIAYGPVGFRVIGQGIQRGSTAESNTVGSQATITFTGTGISWIGARGPSAGLPASSWMELSSRTSIRTRRRRTPAYRLLQKRPGLPGPIR